MEDQLSVFELSLREEIAGILALYQDWQRRTQLGFADNFTYSIDAFSEDYREFGFEKCWGYLGASIFFCWARETDPEFPKASDQLASLPKFILDIHECLGEYSTMDWRDVGFFSKETFVSHAILRMEVARNTYEKGTPYDWPTLGGLVFLCWVAHNASDK